MTNPVAQRIGHPRKRHRTTTRSNTIKSRTMKAALVQMNSVADPRSNLRTIADRTAEAAENGASLVVFPEAAQTPFGTDLSAAAEELDGPWATCLEAIARENGVTVIAGMFRPGSQRHREEHARGPGRGIPTAAR
jgi:predicted amidohydrolase